MWRDVSPQGDSIIQFLSNSKSYCYSDFCVVAMASLNDSKSETQSRRQISTNRDIDQVTEEDVEKSKTLDHNLQQAKTLINGNTTSLVGGLVLTDSDAKSQDRKKFFEPSVLSGTENVINDHDKFAVFMKWLEDNGADMSGLYLKKYTDDVRGVHADRPIASSSQIVTIPVKLLIHEGMGQKTSVGSRVHNDPTCHIIVPAHTQVIIYLLENLNDKECFFKPYFDILPATFNSFPIFWNEEEMTWLEGSDLVRQIEDRKANIAADYNAVCRCCPDFGERHTLEDFLWCRTAVGSRNFGITVNGVKRTTMVPFSDMLNHYRPRETSWTFDDSQQSFTMTSLAPIDIGQQVMDSYGKKCNSKFLLHYGFAIETNREEDGRCQNEIFIEFKMPGESNELVNRKKLQGGRNYKETDPHHNHRLQLAGPTLSIRCMMTFDEKRTQEAFSYCRLAVANQEELADIQVSHLDQRTFVERTHRSAYSLTNNPIHPISARNEIAALLLMAQTCRQQLTRYPTTYQADLSLLKDPDVLPFSNRRHAAIIMSSEKEILEWFVNLSAECTPVLSLPIEDAVAVVNDKYTNTKEDTSRYLRSTVYGLRNRSRW